MSSAQPGGLWADWVRWWTDQLSLGRWLPANLTQPILPGWSFGPSVTINEANSSSPRTEAAILQTNSYGRQLGNLADALEAVIEKVRANEDDPRLQKFLRMQRDIAKVKQRTVHDDVDRARILMRRLEEADRAAYDSLLRELTDRPGQG